MVVFRKKNIIGSKSLGEDLYKARKAFNLSLLAIEKKIGIGKQYLEALENNDWSALPGQVYAKNFLKKYIEFLGLDWPKMKKKFEQDVGKQQIWPMTSKHKFGILPQKLVSMPKILKGILISLIALVILVYLTLQLWSLLSPPKLEIVYPSENYVSQGGFIKIVGKVEHESWLGLNDQEIATDDEGWFSVDMNLNKGLNVIKLEAKKRYGRSTVEYRRIIVQ